ncbi:Gfo/Idh/MocA family oxidoreductase [Nibricoccus sp. IMCC34717]|uniref:Gfo/Idh/MocA family oxidoreductase n=1 Tax=Nibricoccus sp. IMCC34717 TaxID=3034021 RepID=UPI00384A52F6
MNRREFLKTSLAAGAALAVPSLLSSCASPAPRKARRPKPSDRIQVGFVGFGTMAGDSLPNFLGQERVQVVAIADPVTEQGNYGYKGERPGGRLVGQRLTDAHYAQNTASGTYKGCRAYEDFREMFERENLDAIVLSTPDHWHYPITALAARRGIHIYGQKPLSLTIDHGKKMVEEVRRAGITFQTGSQQRSTAYFRLAAEFVRNGRIGKVERIEVGLPGGHVDYSLLGSRNKPEPVPTGFNYDLWLGPAPERPYVPALSQVNWRHNFDYSGGMVTDWGAHHLDIVQWALGLDVTGGPVAIENAVSDLPPPDALYNTPADYVFDVVYANGPRVNVSNRLPNGIRFFGENGRQIFVSRSELTMTPTELRREKIQPGEIHLYESNNHEKNFVDCIYSGQEPVAPIEAGHRTITISHLANIAIRLGRSGVSWDPVTQTIPNDAKATALMSRALRRKYAV